MSERVKPEERVGRLASAHDSGFSMIELLVVIAIIAVMLAVVLPSVLMQRKVAATDDASAQAIDFLRGAYERALTQRQVMRVRIDRAAGTIQLHDENGPGTSDDEMVRQESLFPQSEVAINEPLGYPKPPSPFDFASAAFVDNAWEIRFRSDGVAMNATGAPQSATLYFYVPAAGSSAVAENPLLLNAVTVFGPTASIRLWGYTPANGFVQR